MAPKPPTSPHAELASRVLARRSLLPFVERLNPRYTAGWVHKDICRRLEKFSKDVVDGNSPRLMLLMPPRSGKQLADETPVPTPTGWTTHGALEVGSYVFHPSGMAIQVLAISEKTPSDVQVTLSNGEQLYCHENHEWTVYSRAKGGWKTVSTKFLMSPGRTGKARLGGKRNTYQLPVASALHYSGTEVSTHPYVLGAWLGDGSAGKPCITGAAADRGITGKIESLGYPISAVCTHKTTGVLTTYFSGPRPNVSGRLTRELQALGVYKDKHIPAEYQRLTVELRLELLAGLIDTDGCTDKHGRITFTAANRRLADDVVELCEGLGFRPYTREVQPRLSSSGIQGKKVYWTVGFQPTMKLPVALARKQPQCLAPQRRVGIVAVERVGGSRQGNCIQVDSPDGLYLVGHKLTATHNSELCSRSFPAWHLGRNPDHEIIACSYNVSLAMSFSKKAKGVIEDPVFRPVFDVRLDPNNQSAEEWSLASSCGGYVAAGVGGGITGKGAHLLIIDDPLKNAEEADSPDTREKLWDWYGSTAYTRLAPGGGVLCVQCMTGDTPVMMADGTERRLDSLGVGDAIATFDRGSLATSKVIGFRSNGRDLVYRITTSSGKMVRANGRHPFLATIDGELKWIRTRSLTTAHKIVTLGGNGVSGKGSLAQQLDVANPQSAEGCAPAITTRKNGQTDLVPLASTPPRVETLTLNTGTASPSTTTTPSFGARTAYAPSVGSLLELTSPTTGKISSLSTTATTPALSEACCATTATQESDTLELSPWHLPQPNTSDFTLDEIVSVEPDGEDEVFDLQVARTENFIANGLVSHNTWWHDDDLAGRLQKAMAQDPDADRFVVVKYPAIAETDEWLDPESDLIVDTEPDHPDKVLYRRKGEALHPERYDLQKLNQIKRTISPRFWSALYQQNPVPDDGDYFLKEQFRRRTLPPINRANVFIAWDFAISEKKQNDYTVGTVLLQDEDDTLHVAEVVRFKSGDALFIVDAILHLSKKWYTSSQVVGFEDGQIYRAIDSLLKKRMHEQRQYLSIKVLKPITDKLARARPLQGRMQQGRVSFNADAEWYDACRLELLRFPAGAHDDMVDSLSWAVQLAIGAQPPRKQKVKEPTSWRDKLNLMGHKGSFMAA